MSNYDTRNDPPNGGVLILAYGAFLIVVMGLLCAAVWVLIELSRIATLGW